MTRLMSSRRKGLSQGLEIILILAVLLILVIFSGKLYGQVSSRASREACRASVLAQSVIMNVNAPGTTGTAKAFLSPDCNTNNIKFYDNHLEYNGKTVPVLDTRQKEVVKQYDGLTDDIVNEVLAEELRWCWYQYLEGKKPVLDAKSWITLFSFSKKRLCVLCDEISFDASVKKENFGGFYDYIKNNNMASSNITYYQFLAEQPNLCTEYEDEGIAENCWESYFKDQVTKKNSLLTPESTSFDKNQTYALVFIMLGLAKKEGIGTSDQAFFSYVLPASELANQCDTLQRGSMS